MDLNSPSLSTHMFPESSKFRPRSRFFETSDFGISTYPLVEMDGVLAGDNVGDGGAAFGLVFRCHFYSIEN
jgi:hypothetical protein